MKGPDEHTLRRAVLAELPPTAADRLMKQIEDAAFMDALSHREREGVRIVRTLRGYRA